MRNFATITSDYKYIAVNYFVFNSQTDVRYVISGGFNEHLSKRDLILCINYFLSRLNHYDFADRIKQGFVLEKFKYYELSVYLHGILQLYAANICLPPLCKLYITRFSHLPHDVLKPDKPLLNIEYAVLHDISGKDYCVCLTYFPIYASTYNGLLEKLSRTSLSRKFCFNLVLVNQLPF